MLFAVFIFACGFGHLIDAICATFWPVYRFYAIEKLLTAAASWGTVYALSRMIPLLLSYPSPEQLRKELAEKKLAEQKLISINAELEQFAYIASHDLQEPLRTITSYLQLLKMKHGDKLDGEAEEFVTFAESGAKRMHSLVKDLLIYSRAAQVDRMARVDMSGVIREAIENLNDQITTSKAKIVVEPMPRVRGIRNQLVSLMQNLISNAIKFHKKGVDPVINIIYTLENRHHVISVVDNGIGIAPNFMPKLFNVFQKYHGRDVYEGTGIGLAICKKIIKNHDGDISAHSNEGEGSTFKFTIPVSEVDL